MTHMTATGPRTLQTTIFLILIALLLAACNPQAAPAAPPTQTPEPEIATLSPTPEDTATPEPAAGRIVLVSPNPQPEVETLLQGFAGEHGLEVEVLDGLQPQDIQPNWKIVVLLPAPTNLAELVSGSPGVQFIASSDVDVPAAANLSVIRSRPDHQAFAGGYIGAVITNDWRIAGLLPSDTPSGESLAAAFRNGGLYFCGLCNTLYAPMARWPLVRALPGSSDAAAWQAAFAEMEPSLVYGLYMDPQASSPELLNFLSQKDLVLLGGQTPPAEFLPGWAVTIRPDVTAPLGELLPELLEGAGGQVVNAPIELADVNPRLLSPGKRQLIDTMLADLASGLIAPNTPVFE